MRTSHDHPPTLKDDLLKYLQAQPDAITIEDVLDYLHVRQQILRGQQALRDGHVYTHDEARVIMKKWFPEPREEGC